MNFKWFHFHTNGNKCISHFFSLEFGRHNGGKRHCVRGLKENGDFVQVNKVTQGKNVDVNLFVGSVYLRT
jgi:hypothetical protein